MSVPTPPPDEPDPVVVMTGFARALRASGVAAGSIRLAMAVEALTYVDPLDASQVYWTGRITLCAERDDLPRYDAVFEAWFRGRGDARHPRPVVAESPVAARRAWDSASGGCRPADDERLRTAASDVEVLRRRDIADLSESERRRVDELITSLAPQAGVRKTRRRRAGGRHDIDVSRTLRGMLRDGGELLVLERTRPATKPRRVVFLLDVSGSMSPYADSLLRFAHATARRLPTAAEAFTVGTRLTRVTRQLRTHDPSEALGAAGAAIPDWSGGTRLGDTLRAFLDLWGQQGLARRAVVVIASDGWERGDAGLLGEQMARLARLAHRVIWVNPHRGKAGFVPATAGMAAALPYVDELVAGHTLEALQTLAEALAHA